MLTLVRLGWTKKAKISPMASWDRTTPWRQGNVLDSIAISALHIAHPEFTTETAAIVISHDCDLAQSSSVETFVEVIVGRKIAQSDGNYTHAKNARVLHLPCMAEGGGEVVLELSAIDKQLISKDDLAAFSPDSGLRLEPNERSILQRWLSLRYRRAAFPDEFDRRMRQSGVSERITRVLKRNGKNLRAIFFDVDEGREIARSGADDVYELSIYLLYDTQVDSDAADREANEVKNAIEAVFKARCCSDGVRWQNIELRECIVVSDQAMTVAQSHALRSWHADHISLRDDPPQSMLEN